MNDGTPKKWWCRWCDQELPSPPCGPIEEVQKCELRRRKMNLDAGVPTDATLEEQILEGITQPPPPKPTPRAFTAQFEDHPPISFTETRMPVQAVKDMVVLPGHYKRFKFEPLRVSVENFGPGPLIHKIHKYSMRYDAKNGLEDLYKCRRCVDMLIEYVKGNPDWWDKPKEAV